jgi:release factor glutamine methyltransferase
VTRRAALQQAGERLREAGCESPHVDAEILVADALGVTRTELFAEPERELTSDEEEQVESYVARRARREPAAYIIGEWGFRGLTLTVDPRVLVPRPETEVLVERCLARLEGRASPLVLDVGTGSGAIALAIASEHPDARVVATDISADALALAAENRRRTGLDGRVELVLGNLVAGHRGPFDLVATNPPYVLPEEYESLEPEIRLYEPYEAVVGSGQTAAVARRGREILRPGGWLVVETAERRAAEVAAELRALGYEDVAATPDLSLRDRVVEARQPGA